MSLITDSDIIDFNTLFIQTTLSRGVMKNTGVIFLILFYLLCMANAFAETIFTYRSNESQTDIRREYSKAVLALALDKTVRQYGPYRLVPSKMMNAARSEKIAIDGKLENFFVKLSVSPKRLNEMAYVEFPIDRGIVGYRVFFVFPAAGEKLKNIVTLDQLKAFTMGQNIGWLDAEILRSNGFKVATGSTYEGLFRMVAAGRIDLFPRGANEIYGEIQSHKQIKNLQFDDSVALYYALPRFLFTAKKNIKAAQRIERGLLASYRDGSFNKLWQSHYRQSIEFVDLKNRKIFKIDNPFIKGIDDAYEKYIYHP